jgi:hypothetical protein
MESNAKLSLSEMEKIAAKISPVFDHWVSQYDEQKYPPLEYERFKTVFGSNFCDTTIIQDALEWKWGHSKKVKNKKGYPRTHTELIAEIRIAWADFEEDGARGAPETTFQFWKNKLNRPTSYVTTAFITHLVHSRVVPIIDQHNFRSVNHFMTFVRTDSKTKERPSNWCDVLLVKSFSDQLAASLEKNSDQIDRYLMMFGRDLKQRKMRSPEDKVTR